MSIPTVDPAPPPGTGSAAVDPTCLGPACDFPADLTGLPLTQLQLLHSQISRQLDHEYLTDPTGPHPVTLDRRQELIAELHARTRRS